MLDKIIELFQRLFCRTDDGKVIDLTKYKQRKAKDKRKAQRQARKINR